MNTKTTTPTAAGWHWWRPDVDSPVKDILVTEQDIKSNKFKIFGGEWYCYPTFLEVMNHREAQVELTLAAEFNASKVRDYERVISAFDKFLKFLVTKTFTPKKEVKDFLVRLKKVPILEHPPQ